MTYRRVSFPAHDNSMKAAVARAYGEPEDVLSVRANAARPSLSEATQMKRPMLVKVFACSLSPSDWRTLSGDARLLKKPALWPYIPGGDVCGVVEEVLPGETEFKVGDKIVASWRIFGQGGLSELSIIDGALACHCPPGWSAIEAAALANTLVNATRVIEQVNIQPGERVLILGGSGGMGTNLVQLVRSAGASYVGASSSDPALMASIGVDKCIDYRHDSWNEVDEWKETPFDVVIDCAEGMRAWNMANREGSVLKYSGGRFVAVVLNEWDIVMTKWRHLLPFFTTLLLRKFRNMLSRYGPSYQIYLGGGITCGADIAKAFATIQETKFHAVVDARSPHSFTTSGVRDAFTLLKNRSGHGKIVVKITEIEN